MPIIGVLARNGSRLYTVGPVHKTQAAEQLVREVEASGDQAIAIIPMTSRAGYHDNGRPAPAGRNIVDLISAPTDQEG